MLSVQHGHSGTVMSMRHGHWVAMNHGRGIAALGVNDGHGVAMLSVKHGLENKIFFLLLVDKWFGNQTLIWLFEIFIDVYPWLRMECVGVGPGERLGNLV